jgi:ABC-type spermidine/putrescine transport system permease subunit I
MRNDSGQPVFSFTARLALTLPLLAVSVVFAAIAVIGVSQLAAPERAALAAEYGRAATTALLCLILATPAAACRPSLLWLVPLAATTAAGAAGWALLPLPDVAWMSTVEGAVLLLPAMVLVLGAWWGRIPENLAAAARDAGASPAWVFWHLTLRAALPGVARGLALVFVLALGLAPLLAPAQASP